MAKMSLKMDIAGRLPQFKGTLQEMKNRLPLLRTIGVRMVGSMKKNIDVGGRPVKWKGTHGGPHTIRIKGGRKPGSTPRLEVGRIGRDSGIGGASIQVQDLNNDYVSAGPGIDYMTYFNSGTRPHTIRPKKGKRLFFWTIAAPGQKVNAPPGLHANAPESVQHPGQIARPFAMFQTEDLAFIDDTVARFVDSALRKKD